MKKRPEPAARSQSDDTFCTKGNISQEHDTRLCDEVEATQFGKGALMGYYATIGMLIAPAPAPRSGEDEKPGSYTDAELCLLRAVKAAEHFQTMADLGEDAADFADMEGAMTIIGSPPKQMGMDLASGPDESQTAIFIPEGKSAASVASGILLNAMADGMVQSGARTMTQTGMALENLNLPGIRESLRELRDARL